MSHGAVNKQLIFMEHMIPRGDEGTEDIPEQRRGSAARPPPQVDVGESKTMSSGEARPG